MSDSRRPVPPVPSLPHLLPRRAGRALVLGLILVVAILGTLVVTWVLVTMFSHKQDARQRFVRLADISEISVDPKPWGLNWPSQYDGYLATAGDDYYGGSSALPESKLDQDPWLRRLYAGYAFSIDYREARGHAYMLHDQTVTERVTKRSQSGACLHCHASTSVLYRREGLKAMGRPADDAALATAFDMDAVTRGFEAISTAPYHEVLAMLQSCPDGTPDAEADADGNPDAGTSPARVGGAHPVSCIDCHDPETMALRITRPGFMQGIADFAASDEPAPHMPSIERWRRGDRTQRYDPNALATRQEMRSFTCGQCHVEYYCANKMTLEFPWGNGLQMEDLERYWTELDFPDGTEFLDYRHGETGARTFKVQHPEFELWSQGVHARSGVSCADCHMPYERQGAMKVSRHNVRSPLESINNSCQTCHNVEAEELRGRVAEIQRTTRGLLDRAAAAMTDMLDAILEAKAAGVTDEQLADVLALQTKAMWRLDYISSENSRGFHAPQESARILGESIDFSRQAQVAALRLRAGEAPSTESLPVEPVQGVTESRGE